MQGHLVRRSSAHPRRVMAFSCLALAVACATASLLLWYELPGQRQRLPNGWLVDFRAVTRIGEPPFVDETGARRLFRLLSGAEPVLPRFFTSEPSPEGTGQILWFRLWEPPNSAASSGFSWREATVDEHGCRIRAGSDTCGSGSSWVCGLSFGGHCSLSAPRPGPDGSYPSSVSLEAFPRRRPGFRYVCLREPNTEPACGFEVPNCLGTRHPSWKALPFPISMRRGDALFTLLGLEHRPLGDGGVDQSIATFRYEEQCRTSREWQPDRVIAMDATGNRLETAIRDEQRPESALFHSLCRQESAWKLKVRFCRSNCERFPPNWTWTLKDLPVPRKSRYNSHAARTSRGGVSLRLLRVTGDGRTEWADGISFGPEVNLEVAAPAPGVQVTLLRAWDERGRSLVDAREPDWGRTSLCEGSGQECSFGLASLARSRRLNLEIAVHRTREVEFLARP